MFLILRNFLLSIVFFAGSFSQAGAIEQLSWQDCLREAAKNHPDLIAAQEDVLQGQEAKKIIASAGLPQISADLGASTSNSSNAGSTKSFDYGVSASQLLFDGTKTTSNIHAAAEDIKVAKENFRFTSTQVRLRLRSAFIDLLRAQELISLTQEIYNLRKSNLELITLRYESGTEHKGALLTAKANISQSLFEINQAQRGLETAQRRLIKELGRSEFVPVTVRGDFEVGFAEGITPDFDRFAEKNPSLLKVKAQKNAAAFSITANRGNFWPEVLLDGGVGKSENEWPPHKRSSSGGIRVSVPLFSGGANIARVEQAKSVYRQLEQEERSIKDGIILALQTSWSSFADAVEKVKVQKDFLLAIEERSKIAQAQYSVGLISFDNWTIIEDDLVSSRKSFLDVQAAALSAEANWIQAKGETLEYEN